MAVLDAKIKAGLRILVAVAQADGELHDMERNALEEAFAGHPGLLDELLSEDIDLDTQIAALGGDDAERRRIYEAAYAIAYSDGYAHTFEVNALKKILPDAGEKGILAQIFGEARDTFTPSSILPVADPVARKHEILEDTFKYSVLSAVVGAMPIPGIAILNDLMVVGFQAKLVRDIGQYWGHKVDRESAKTITTAIVGGAGLRIAVNNVMRFVPGWGSAFGAATSFASTWAVGQVGNAYFESGQAMDKDAMRKMFREQETLGRAKYSASEDSITATRDEHLTQLEELNRKLAKGEITQQEYRAQLESTLA
jgi:uncharacterized protein (DUF697 family)